MAGLVGIDLCLAEVKELGLTDESQIAEELIERVKKTLNKDIKKALLQSKQCLLA